MFARKVHDLRHLGLCYLVGINATFADPVVMHMQHNSCGSFMILAEEPLQHVHNELHWRVVVVENEHPVHVWPLGLRLGLGDDSGARPTLVPALAIVIGHPRRGATRLGRAGWTGLAGSRRHGQAEANYLPWRLHHGRAGTWPSTIIETRAQLFQVANSLKAASFRDKEQNFRDFRHANPDNYCLNDRNPFAGKLRQVSPNSREILFLKAPKQIFKGLESLLLTLTWDNCLHAVTPRIQTGPLGAMGSILSTQS